MACTVIYHCDACGKKMDPTYNLRVCISVWEDAPHVRGDTHVDKELEWCDVCKPINLTRIIQAIQEIVND